MSMESAKDCAEGVVGVERVGGWPERSESHKQQVKRSEVDEARLRGSYDISKGR